MYERSVDRESAYEKLKARAGELAAQPAAKVPPAGSGKAGGGVLDTLGDVLGGSSRRQGVVEAMVKSAARTIGSQLGRQILRGVLGGILGGKK